jgi:hypothetical protein
MSLNCKKFKSHGVGYEVVSRVNPNMINQILMDGVVGCPISNIVMCMEKLLQTNMPVQGLERLTHPENPTLDYRHYDHAPPK